MIDLDACRQRFKRQGLLQAGDVVALLAEVEMLTTKLEGSYAALDAWQPVRDRIQRSLWAVGSSYPDGAAKVLDAAYEVARLWSGMEACTTTYAKGSMELDEALERLGVLMRLMGPPQDHEPEVSA